MSEHTLRLQNVLDLSPYSMVAAYLQMRYEVHVMYHLYALLWTKGIISSAVNKHDSNIFTGMDYNGLVWDKLIQKIRLIEQKCSEITSLVNVVRVTCYHF